MSTDSVTAPSLPPPLPVRVVDYEPDFLPPRRPPLPPSPLPLPNRKKPIRPNRKAGAVRLPPPRTMRMNEKSEEPTRGLQD